MSINIGIEGGGTRTRVLVERENNGGIFYQIDGSFKVQNGKYRASTDALFGTLIQLLGEELSDVKSIGIGLAGMSREEDQDKWKFVFRNIPELRHINVHIESDATLTLSAVLPAGNEGILLIAGTGSVIFFQPQGGTPRRIGGWGPLLSDEGSGYRIGLRALSYYVKVLDGVYPPDTLSQGIANLLPEKVREDRMGIAKLAEKDARFVANLAPLAFESSQELGPVHDLVYEELIDLATMIFPVFITNVMSGHKPYKLYLAGSIAKHPVMVDVLQNGFEETDVELISVEDHVPCIRALEIARSL